MTRPDPYGGEAPLPQAWVPRVFNAALAVLLLALVLPVVTTLGRHGPLVRVYLVLAVLPVLLVVGLCLAAALRPGSLGRAARRVRARSAARRGGSGERTADPGPRRTRR